jgi:ribosome-associated protein
MGKANAMDETVLAVNRRIRIPHAEFTLTFVRSSGPGGQNVNKVATKAQLRWNVSGSPSLPDSVRQRFLEKYRRRVTVDGELVMTSQRYRDQKRNADDCLEKLREMLTAVATPPKPRKKTKPSRGAIERRLREKRERGSRKQSRRRPEHGE